MDNGGRHKVSVPSGDGPDGGVFEHSSFDAPNPAVDAARPGDLMVNAAVDPLAGRSGKDSLTEEEAQLA